MSDTIKNDQRNLINKFDTLYHEIKQLIAGKHVYDTYYSPQLYDAMGEEVSIYDYVNCVFMDLDMYIDIFHNRIEISCGDFDTEIPTTNYLTCSEEEMFMQSTLEHNPIFNNHMHVLEALIKVSLITREHRNESNTI